MTELTEDDLELIKNYKNVRKGHKGRVTYFRNKLDNNGFTTLNDFESALSRLRITYEKFDDIQSKIDSYLPDDTEERFQFEDDYGVVESLILSKITDLKIDNSTGSQNTQISSVNHNSVTSVKLPEISLPHFDGTHTEWLQFRNRFTSLIHDNSKLDSISKFQYLISSIESGKAYVLIADLPITIENYSTAWKLIVDHYDNEVAIQKEHMAHIYDIEKPKDGSADSLESFVNTVVKNLAALKSLKIPLREMRSLKKTPFNKILTNDEFVKLLRDRVHYLKEIKSVNNSSNNSSNSGKSKSVAQQSKNHSSKSLLTSSSEKCTFCTGNHSLVDCAKFKNPQVSPRQRFNFVRSKKLCGNCLIDTHRVSDCKQSPCSICSLQHNSLLHFGGSKNSNSSNNNTPKNPLPSENPHSSKDDPADDTLVSANSTVQIEKPSQILLATAVVKIRNKSGDELFCRVLLDNGSQSNFITSKIVNLLNLRKYAVSIPISGISENLTVIRHKVVVEISSRVSDFTRDLECLVLPKITGNLPTKSLNLDSKLIPNHFDLADPSFFIANEVDLLIGAELFWEIMSGKKVEVIKELPAFQDSVFGLVLTGKIDFSKMKNSSNSVSLFCCHSDELNNQVKKFWQLEEIKNPNEMSLEEKRCEKHYVQNVNRDETGRYSVALPVKENISTLGDSRSNALRQFDYLERKLNNNPQLREQYCQFMDEYLAMNHMEIIENPETIDERYGKSYYVPHHAVLRESSSTTKLRVVFNASSKTSTGISLNDCLMVGPTIQQDLFSIVLRFRKYKIALTGDIAKMYRQIKLFPSERDLLRILWRKNSDDEVQCYRLSTVTYGTASAPFLAIRTLTQLANDESAKYPNASNVLKRDFYVDDLLTGANSIQDAKQLKSDLTNLLNLGGFELRKFESNFPQLSESVDKSKSETENAVSILGINWNKSSDSFEMIFPKLDISALCTKRNVLSEIAQLFDPMGLCAPMIFLAKLFLQSLWTFKDLTWDDPIQSSLANDWQQFKQDLSSIETFSVPRCVINSTYFKSVELHGFGDASEKGYGCSVYVRVVDNSNKVHVNLLCAKSRVSPLKKLTIPRLELCASLLLAQLMKKVLTSMEIDFSNIFCWSDSEITLCRIKSSPSNFTTFVANRVSQIQDLSSPDQWFFVPTQMNPADLVSRGLRPTELLDCSLWWHGPSFLLLEKPNWPKPKNTKIDSSLLELRKPPQVQSLPAKIDEHIDAFLRYSSLTKIGRIAAICLRFKKYHRSSSHDSSESKVFSSVTAEEIDNALKGYAKYIQSIEYETEIKSLKSSKTVSQKSRLKSLCPFLDANGLLRVGGRLSNADISYDNQHQILLPASSHLSRLIVEHEHFRNLHCGPQALLYHVRQRFWITNGRNLCRNVVTRCVRCFRTRPQLAEQIMGQLPFDRVNPYTPFQMVGVDFCGPFLLTEKLRSKVQRKVYIAVFVCFVVKGVHLEIVPDLTTEAFISALRRFCGRRGDVTHIYSDNATNFVGAKAELAELSRLYNSELHKTEVQRFCANEKIEWHTIPPRSPHFGGLWEAAVKSAKYHLKRVVGPNPLTFDQLFTLSVQVEGCLNSRPLTPLSNDPSDLRCLTPAHFWRGMPINALPDPSLLHLDFNRLSLYQKTQYQFQQFWKRWSSEYLSELQQSKKWVTPKENIVVGSLVLLKEDHTPPIKWNLARVLEVHKGKDGFVRVVTVKTKDSIFKRAISKVCVLPIDDKLITLHSITVEA